MYYAFSLSPTSIQRLGFCFLGTILEARFGCFVQTVFSDANEFNLSSRSVLREVCLSIGFKLYPQFEETTVVTVASDQREARALRRGFFSSPFFCGGSAPSCISVSASRANRALTLFRTADNAFKSALFRVLLSGGRGVRAKFSKIFWRNRKSLSLLERLPHVAPAGKSATSVLQSLL
jgi:hypothetical protein